MSFQIGLSPHKRAAGRFVEAVRRALQQALVEEKARNGTTQAEIARVLGVHRSVINREFQGLQDLSLSRVAELAFALNRKAILDLPVRSGKKGSNINPPAVPQTLDFASSLNATAGSSDKVARVRGERRLPEPA
jgi:transcriptional regulator with XRE-family HTH domain